MTWNGLRSFAVSGRPCWTHWCRPCVTRHWHWLSYLNSSRSCYSTELMKPYHNSLGSKDCSVNTDAVTYLLTNTVICTAWSSTCRLLQTLQHWLGPPTTTTCYSPTFSWFPASLSRAISATFTLTYLQQLLSRCFVSCCSAQAVSHHHHIIHSKSRENYV